MTRRTVSGSKSERRIRPVIIRNQGQLSASRKLFASKWQSRKVSSQLWGTKSSSGSQYGLAPSRCRYPGTGSVKRNWVVITNAIPKEGGSERGGWISAGVMGAEVRGREGARNGG
eukprot:755020-Hanusia_phi.AAC.4